MLVVGDVLDADDRGAVGELDIVGLEECAGGVGGRSHDDAGGAHFEVHDGAIAFGEAGESRVRCSADEGDCAEHREAGWSRWEVAGGSESEAVEEVEGEAEDAAGKEKGFDCHGGSVRKGPPYPREGRMVR